MTSTTPAEIQESLHASSNGVNEKVQSVREKTISMAESVWPVGVPTFIAQLGNVMRFDRVAQKMGKQSTVR